MVRVRLTRLDQFYRVAEGYAPRPPIVGEKFRVFGSVATPKVVEICANGEFRTRRGRRYRVEILETGWLPTEV